MKTLIILKGLVKKRKLDWVKEQGLDLFFIDYNIIRNLYSAPELLTSDKGVLNFSFSDIVYKRFIEIVCFRMSKGCLIVLDIENLSYNTIEGLAVIFGYNVFWVIDEVPKDYLRNAKDYVDSLYPIKSKLELKKDILNYNNSIDRLNPDRVITKYSQVVDFWNKRTVDVNTTYLNTKSTTIHVSDIHSNYNIYKSINVDNYSLCIFYGDYIDGPVKGGSRKMLDDVLSDRRSNIVWLEGNHESRLRKYLGAKYMRSIGKDTLADTLLTGIPEEFFTTTALEFSDIKSENILDYLRLLNNKLELFHILKTPKNTFVCTHSGFRYIDQISPKYIGNVVYGTRNIDKIDKTFSDNRRKKNLWSIHAHCKYPLAWKVDKYSHVLNIDPIDEYEVVILTLKNTNFNICKIRQEELI